ncbi:MAG TPA: benzoate-CoA ligase family protein [Candidatus Kapabacteria bacterium]|jgi:2-aminobenzoate-CoA ligase|nr:benzoate-CoA ligase family protein [Candidatus Kapabacteria bacterium]
MAHERFQNELPPKEDWGERIYTRPELQYPDELNAAAELLDRNVAEGRSNRPAIFYKDQIINYGELLAGVNKMGNALKSLGVGKGDRVMLRFPNTPTAVTAWLATLKIGGVAVTIMPMLRAREISYRANDAGCKVVLCDAASIDEVRKAEPAMDTVEKILICDGVDSDYDSFESHCQNASLTLAPEKLSRYDLSLIGYTSGSTGDAKGTVHFQDDVLAIADGYARNILAPTQEDIFGGHPSLAFTFGLGGLLVFPFRFGASTVLLDQFTPENMLKTLARYKCTLGFCAPTCYNMMMRLDEKSEYDLSNLRLGVSAGETLPKPIYDKWKAKYGIDLLDGIGSTEMLHIFVSNRPGNVRGGATGKPVPGYEAKIIDETGRDLPPNEPGLIAIKGPTACRYWNKPERQRAYVMNGWNVPGDVFTMDNDGYFYYQCRNDDLIITGGYNVSPPELESVINEHPAVRESAVVPKPDDLRGSIVKAYVVLQPGTLAPGAGAEPHLVKDIQDFVKRELAPYKYPREIEFIDALPRTDTGKVQRFVLRDRAKLSV